MRTLRILFRKITTFYLPMTNTRANITTTPKKNTTTTTTNNNNNNNNNNNKQINKQTNKKPETV
jgi:hypothetical protein